jgi:hypothetical protein
MSETGLVALEYPYAHAAQDLRVGASDLPVVQVQPNRMPKLEKEIAKIATARQAHGHYRRQELRIDLE